MTSKLFITIVLFTLALSQQASAQPAATTQDSLHKISSLTVNGQFIELPKDSILRKYLTIEMITEEQFLAKEKTQVRYLVSDTIKFRKKKGILRLPTTTGNKIFTDKITDSDDQQEHEYLGQISFLNAYLVRTMFWEDMNYDLISKMNGANIGSFSSMPYLSPDKRKIATAYADPYETDCEIAMFSVINGRIKNTLNARFHHWMPGDETKIFWGSDGKLYMPVQFSEKFWKQDGSFNTEYMYVRISLL